MWNSSKGNIIAKICGLAGNAAAEMARRRGSGAGGSCRAVRKAMALGDMAKHFGALLLVLVLVFSLSACGSDNYTSDGSEDAGNADQAVSDGSGADGASGNEENGAGSSSDPDVAIPEAEAAEVQQTVTVKAGADGTPISAKLKSSNDDMETDVSLEKLPFKVNVRYFLEDKEVSSDEIAGATGNVRIRFDYENNTDVTVDLDGQEAETKVPLAFVTLVTVSEDKLYNVEVNSGDVTEVSGNRIIYGYALPGVSDQLGLEKAKDKLESVGDSLSDDIGSGDGLPEYVEISGYAVNFSLDFTATMVTNGLLKEIEEDDLDDIADSIKDLGEFADAGDEMVDGVTELRNGADKFGDALDKYVDGAAEVDKVAAALADGAEELSDGAKELKDGAAELSSGADTLDKNGEDLKTGAAKLTEGLTAIEKALGGTGESGVNGGSGKSGDNGDTGENGDEPADKDASSMVSQETLEAAIGEIGQETAQSVLDSLKDNENLTEEEKAAIAQTAGQAAAEKAAEKVKGIMEQAFQSEDGAEEADPMTALRESISALAEGASQLEKGIGAYTEGVGKLADGASGLSEGASQLAGGAKELSTGAGQLVEGTGILASYGSKLTKGYGALEDGIGELKKGVSELNDEVFVKIGSLSEGALPETIHRLKAMRLADLGFTAWDTYDGEEGSVMFILETAEVK